MRYINDLKNGYVHTKSLARIFFQAAALEGSLCSPPEPQVFQSCSFTQSSSTSLTRELPK
jgi:hypothetical protein